MTVVLWNLIRAVEWILETSGSQNSPLIKEKNDNSNNNNRKAWNGEFSQLLQLIHKTDFGVFLWKSSQEKSFFLLLNQPHSHMLGWYLLTLTDPSHISDGVMERWHWMCQKKNRLCTYWGESAVHGQYHIMTT